GLERIDVSQLHAPLDAAQDGGGFVAAEIMPRTPFDLGENPLEQATLRRFQLIRFVQREHRCDACQSHQLCWDVRYREYQIDLSFEVRHDVFSLEQWASYAFPKLDR